MSTQNSKSIPPVDFSALILGFSSAALQALGVSKEDETTEKPNFGLARHNIDIIELLANKTSGNLTEQEEKLIMSILHDLRTKFVEISKL